MIVRQFARVALQAGVQRGGQRVPGREFLHPRRQRRGRQQPRVRLDGLDAPTQVAISTPDAARVEAYISQVLALAGVQGAAEEASEA